MPAFLLGATHQASEKDGLEAKFWLPLLTMQPYESHGWLKSDAINDRYINSLNVTEPKPASKFGDKVKFLARISVIQQDVLVGLVS